MNEAPCIEKGCPFPRYKWTMRCLDHWQELGVDGYSGGHRMTDRTRIVIPDPEPAVLLEAVKTDEGRVEIWGAEWRASQEDTE